MGNRYARILAAGGAAALALTLGVPAALASGTWTIQPGGGIQAASGKLTLSDTTTRQTLNCASSTVSGKLKSGSGRPGFHAGSLSAVSFVTCTSPGVRTVNLPRRFTFTLQAGGLPWHVNFSAYDAAEGVARGTISHLHLALSGAGCAAMIDGTSATADNGRAAFKYTDSTGALRLTTGGNLHWYDVSGCLGLVNDGDRAALSAIYTLSPKQAITSP